MFDHRQYKRGYYMPPEECNDWVKPGTDRTYELR